MKLFLVARWGHDGHPDGPNSADTVYLVRAEDHVSAAEMVDGELSRKPRTNVQPFASYICQIGRTTSKVAEFLLTEPTIAYLYFRHWEQRWTREEPGEQWELCADSDPPAA